MSCFAEIDGTGMVKRVIVADQSFINSGAVGDPKNWIETDTEGSLRKNYAGVGYIYDRNLDVFIPPKPFNSWILNLKTVQYEAPVPRPPIKGVVWDEKTLSWVKE